MDKLKVMKQVNALLFLVVCAQAVTGLVLFFFDEGRVVMFLGNVHKYNGPLLGILIGTHLWLNWSVIKNHYFTKRPTPVPAGTH